MALNPTASYEAFNKSQTLVITDTTVYGTSGNPDRDECEVNIEVFRVVGGVATQYQLDYDPETVTAWSVAISGDGYYRFIMTIDDGTDTPLTVQYDFVLMQNLCFCYVNKANAVFKASVCGCENYGLLQALYCLEAQIRGAEVMAAQNDYESAAKAVERLNQECEQFGKGGCGC
jgi:hypothetical protein